ncbi:hypothetical protein OIU84_013414 [Salix udensis]|uniref:Uncharacterized protein n=1 Tax=Salix udensis TaxID=889485 RepID=A0AAD6NUP5_9ROSI|nr:hypothetical protein OIU84_013414 [Salix udensis]
MEPCDVGFSYIRLTQSHDADSTAIFVASGDKFRFLMVPFCFFSCPRKNIFRIFKISTHQMVQNHKIFSFCPK